MSQAGAFIRHQGLGQWLAATPKDQWPEEADERIAQGWHEFYGDRKQEIVFIGLSAEMDQESICAQLDECLIKDYHLNPETHAELDDPFPQWFEQPIEEL